MRTPAMVFPKNRPKWDTWPFNRTNAPELMAAWNIGVSFVGSFMPGGTSGKPDGWGITSTELSNIASRSRCTGSLKFEAASCAA